MSVRNPFPSPLPSDSDKTGDTRSTSASTSAAARRHLFLRTFALTMLPVAALLALLAFLIFRQVVPTLEKNHLQQKRELCRRLVQVQISDLRARDEDVRRGLRQLEEVQNRALSFLRRHRFGDEEKDYFWVMDARTMRLLMHPYRPDLEGVDPGTARGPDGHMLLDITTRISRAVDNPERAGYVDYQWHLKDRLDVVAPKISYVELFEPWGWVVGTGVYLDDVAADLAAWRQRLTNMGLAALLVACAIALPLSYRSATLRSREKEAQAAIRHTEERFRTVFATSPMGIAVNRMKGGAFLDVNPAFERLTGFSREELLGRNALEVGIFGASQTQRLKKFYETIRREGQIPRYTTAAYRKDGAELHILLSACLIDVDGETCLLTTSMDVTDAHRLGEANAELEARIRERTASLDALDEAFRQKLRALDRAERQLALATKVFEHADEAVMITDREATILSVNPAFTAITGYSSEEALGRNPRILKSDRHDKVFFEEMWKALAEHHSWSGEIWNRRRNGEAFPAMLHIVACTNDEGEVTEYIGTLQDLSELHSSRNKLLHQAFHDGLTELPNRFLFEERLALACENAQSSGGMLAVVHLGLDRFGTVNKTLGFPTGDALLREAGERLQETVASKAEVARFGGDEFVVLLSDVEDLGQSVGTVERMLDILRRPFFLGTEAVQMSASAGMALYPRDGETPEMLLQNAALAMERAKREGGNTYRLFTELLDKQVQRRLRLEAQLRRAVATGEFVLHYQPKVTADRGFPVGVEALLRWRDEEGRIVSPTEFIPLAEEIGEIGRLGIFALETACRTALEWQRSGHDLVMAVNISPKQFAGDDLVDLVLDTLSRTGLEPTRLELEITESAFLENPTATVRAMERLASRGVRFSLDDFGTGYSSLSYIRFLPLAGIKIDRTFMTDLAGERTRAIISTMIHLARELRLELTMEGVETAKQLALLQRFGSDFFVQGYLFSRPLPEADALTWIRTAAQRPDGESPRESRGEEHASQKGAV